MTNIFFKISVKKVYLRVTTRTDDVSALHHALKNCGELYNMSKFNQGPIKLCCTIKCLCILLCVLSIHIWLA